MNPWSLPESVVVAGCEYAVNADYRDILDIIARLTDESEPEHTRITVAMALFYNDFDALPAHALPEAAEKLMQFINCGQNEADAGPRPKTIDWEQDQFMIASDINNVAGCDVRALPFCHWWTFISWFNVIGDGQLSTVVSIREKRRKGKKLEKWENEFYRDNREKIDFKRKYTGADDDVLKAWGAW